MYMFNPDVPLPPYEADARDKCKWAVIWAIICGLPVLFLIFQTECFVGFFTPQAILQTVPAVMSEDREKQRRISERFEAEKKRQCPRGLQFKQFTPHQQRMLETAKKSLDEDADYQKFREEFERKYGAPFGQLNAVVLPAWIPFEEPNLTELGITDKGVRSASESMFVGGFTVRDRAKHAWDSTLDGTPRIVIDFNEFRSIDSLRLALFHEMLHALNVPGYYPCSLNLCQVDLVYLPEYQGFAKRLPYSVAWMRLDSAIWGLILGLSFGFCFFLVRAVLYARRRE